MTDSSSFSLDQAVLDLAGVALTAGQLRSESGTLSAMLEALPSQKSAEPSCQPHACLGQVGGRLWQDAHLSVITLGEPYWLSDNSPARPQAIGDRYRNRGMRLLDDLAGQFVLLISDEAAGTVDCAVDRFARESLYWYGDTQGLVVASSADALFAHPAVPRELSNQGLFNYLFFHMVPAPDSVYQDIHKLPAAHHLHWQSDQLIVVPYWQPSFLEENDAPNLEAGVLQNLDAAVARCSEGADSGSFLSGGLDSSTVSGLLAKQQPGADAYSIGFDAAGYDEIAFARIAAKHFGNTGHEYYVRPDDVLSALPRIAAAYDEPFGNSSALPALFCAAFAKQDGRQRLLAGDGGDELYAGNARYAKQKIFELFQGLPGFMQGTLRTLTRPIPSGVPLVSKAKSYVEQASVPLPDRLQTYNYLCRLGVETMFDTEFLSSIDSDQPLALARDIYHRPAEASSLNRMLYLDWHHTLADNDLRKVGRMCALAGIEVRYPMLDEAVLQHSLQVPSARKLPGQKLRDFYKQATAGFLPEAIINKPKQGFGLPFGVWMAEHPGLREMAADNLSKLRSRDILKPTFIDQAMSLHQQEHAHYYGELVWVMMMLELWLTSRGF